MLANFMLCNIEPIVVNGKASLLLLGFDKNPSFKLSLMKIARALKKSSSEVNEKLNEFKREL